MKLTLEKTIILFFVLAVIALISALLVFDINNQRAKETGELIEKTQETLKYSEKVLADVIDVVSGARGFVITGDEVFLEPYKEAVKTIHGNVFLLEKNARNSPSQQLRINSLKKLNEERLEFSKNLIEVRQQLGFKEAQKIIANLNGKILTDKIRKLIGDINAEELLFLEQKKSENKKFASNSAIVFIAILIVVIVILALVFIIIISNQKKRNKIETELKQSNDLFSGLFNHNPAAIAITGLKDGKIIDVNEAFLELFERTDKAGLIGKSSADINQLLHPGQRDEVVRMLKENKAVKDFEVEMRTGTGKHVWVSSSVLILEIDQIPCLLSVSIDITERKRAGEKLKEYQHFFNKSRDLSCIANMDGYFEILNPNFEKVLGYSEEELLGSKIINFIHPDFVDATLLEIEKLKAGEPTISFVNRSRKKDGSYLWFDWSVTPNPLTQKLYAIGRDITEKKTDELRLEITTNHLKEAQSLAKVGNWGVNLITGKSSWSDEVFAILGLDKDGAEPSPELFTSTIHPDDMIFVKTKIQEVGHTHQAAQFNYRVLKKNGEVIHALARAGFDFDESGKPVRLFGIVQDITEIKKAEEALKISEEKFRQLINLAPVGIALSSMKGEVLEVNQAMVDMIGLKSKKEFIDTPAEEFHVDKSARAALIDLLKKDGFIKDFEIRFKRVNAEPIWVLTNVIPFKLPNGETGLISANINITEQKQQKEQIIQFNNQLEQKVRERTLELSESMAVLKRSEEQLSETGAVARVGGWEIILSTMTVRWTDQVFRIHELEPGKMPPVEEAINYYAPEARPVIQEAVNKAIATGEGWDLELPFITAKGNHLWVRAKGKAEMLNGKAIRVYGVFQDITERKKADQSLKEALERFSYATGATCEIIYDWLIEEDKVWWNDAYYTLTGIKKDKEWRSLESWSAFIHPDDHEWVLQSVTEFLECKENFWSGEYRFLDKDANIYYLEDKGYVLRDADGKPYRMIGAVLDITERKKAKQKLIEQNTELKKAEEAIRSLNEGLEQRVAQRTVELEAVNKELESFSYSVSHDLRAPLRAIHGYSTILQEDYAAKMDNEGLMALNSIRQNSKRMGGLIDDLLAFSRLGRKEISVSEINMNALVKSILEENTDFNSSKINFTIHNLPPANGDQSLIKQVWVNLISNAFKYSQQKTKINIEIGSSVKNNFIEYYIKDNGAGFDMQYYNKLFGVFQRLHSQEEFEGTGIGLAIVQKIISRHKGTVWADSKVDEGAVFYFSLPVS